MKKFLWVEQYRPQKIDDCILPANIKKAFKGFVEKGEIPNLLLTGTAGVGKTTIAKAVCDEIGASYIVINGSDEGRFLDTVRNRVRQFATTVSLTSGAPHKVVIIDEADNTTADVQLSLRTAVEEFHNNCRFIFTCNFQNKIIEPLHSRCTVFDFRIQKEQQQQLQGQFFLRLKQILDENEVEYQDKVVVKLIQRYYPDWRRLINEAQRHASTGKIDTDILCDIADVNLSQLMNSLKNKEFSTVRKWVVDNIDNDPNIIMRKIYDAIYENIKPKYIPEVVLILAKYQYQIAFVADQEINLLACLTEVMMSCEFR
ncbi:clamp loader subunit [Cyanophage S-RIM44]|uniref:Sliding-clamp-loader large subunit n=2 Tax=Vellamovirus TaxID=2733139 RepID=A0A127KMT5_9CAUD|nr:clamp loader of DNA polymerase [Prochlorococcus phage Syn1]AMO43384.1 clamp loader subunit [Cyanophage S-RIM44]ADO99242.1 clamp loader subunit [Prochlorococcus phage Syn1]AOO11856.1 clamp loader subunit [Cyanophage S-RIM44]AOO12094.1 clamp loader subunit [Cyanophage S-RIM44]AOO12557.1 clamp loader subunit [Cyanophage S-RIM44]